ncbi:hypothetical protein D3C80_1622980 [compost metagenome]
MLVLVAAQAQLGGQTIPFEAVLDEGGTVPATVLVERCAAVDAVFVPVGPQQQAVALVDAEIVLPAR